MKIVHALIQSPHSVEILFAGPPKKLKPSQIRIDGLEVRGMRMREAVCRVKTSEIDIQQTYTLEIEGFSPVRLRPDRIFNAFRSDKLMGCSSENGDLVFRLFAPRAGRAQLVLFDRCDRPAIRVHDMTRDESGVWECRIPYPDAKYYAYRLDGRAPHVRSGFSEIDIPDPYSAAVVTENHHHHAAKTLIQPPDAFDWQDDSWICPKPEELVIYELHVRDMTIHESSGLPPGKRGRYLGLSESGHRGGLDYIKNLGVNAVELLPVHEFANIEVPYKDPNCPIWNTWNPYARNHWGYMTSFYFAPESYYATGQTLDSNTVSGADGSAVPELKQLVRTFHQAGMAVILDVVYNHVSQYDFNPLKSIDREYYFRLDEHGGYCAESGCGNDLNTARPMVRKLIVDSIVYWMRAFHIDGFRFDLAGLIDDATLDAVSEAARSINPNVILIGEPWGGPYHGQYRFSERGWSSWNDWYRNGIKGFDPVTQKGLLFAEGDARQAVESLRHFLKGTLTSGGGPFLKPGHSVNYLACHDGYTLGDFIRIACGRCDPEEPVRDGSGHYRLTPDEMRMHKLAALILLTGQGAVMLHAGQEFGRSKVIADTEADDPRVGRLDHDSYNKDNPTNWIQYDHADLNQELVRWYRNLIAIRKTRPHFTDTKNTRIDFFEGNQERALGMRLCLAGRPDVVVLYNLHPNQRARFKVEGRWACIVPESANGAPELNGDEADLPAQNGAILEAADVSE